MSLYKAYLSNEDDKHFIWKKFGMYSLRFAYTLNLTNVGVKRHKLTPVEEDGFLVVSPYEEGWDSYYKEYINWGWYSGRRAQVSEIFR